MNGAFSDSNVVVVIDAATVVVASVMDDTNPGLNSAKASIVTLPPTLIVEVVNVGMNSGS